MAGIDLATAQTHLDKWLSIAEGLDAQLSVSFEGRSYTRSSLSQINDQIDYWDRQVRRLSRGSAVSVTRVIVND